MQAPSQIPQNNESSTICVVIARNRMMIKGTRETPAPKVWKSPEAPVTASGEDSKKIETETVESCSVFGIWSSKIENCEVNDGTEMHC